MKTASILLILLLGIFGVPLRTSAEGQWHFQAALEVPGPGLTEALLPAGLFFSGGTTGPDSLLDLSLEGPDGNPRSFELYWKEENSTRILVLEASRVYLDKTRGLIWEAAPPRNFKIEKIHIEFAARQEMGQVSIEAMDFRGWHRLAENAALYRVEDGLKADIRIEPAVYEQLRLFFRGYDKDFRETPFLVKSVSLSGKNIAKDYAEETVNLHFIEAKQEGEKVISALFPGSGLWIKSLFVSTEAQFQGEWKLGREIIGGNGPRFQELLSGRVTTVSGKASRMEIPVNRFWPGRSLVLKLDPGGRYLGKIAGMRITTHLPRIVFFADKAGVYLAQAGSGNRALVKEFSGDPERRIDRVLSFSEVTENRTWRPESLAEKFLIKGGPFTEKGYRWTAKVRIPEPGYYRIVLNREASLFLHPDSIRLVREGVQVPFFKGQYETREIDLRASSEYDAVKNVTCWTIELPGPAGQLKELTLGTQGIFQRNVIIDIPKAGHTGWQ
ncbi:MAG: hypothetical protein OEW04_14855, partial [Nitrospirota bacterium]|nr:hypothetical protein [Nitrospirota bacterium]